MAAEIGLFEAIVYGGVRGIAYHCPVIRLQDGTLISLVSGKAVEAKSMQPMGEHRKKMFHVQLQRVAKACHAE